MTDIRQPLDIFVGGSMGNTRSDGAGLTFDAHLPNIVAVIQRIISEYEAEQREDGYRLEILDPSREAVGQITDRVFSMIDRSELGVFDCSNAAPGAMYELTLMHALGKPVIPIAFSEPQNNEARTLPHYLKDDYGILVGTFSQVELYEKLSEKFQLLLAGEDDTLNASMNAISRFYGLPLLDVSATTGLATGYFHNFLRHQLEARAQVFVDLPELEAIVIVKPSTLHEVEGIKDVLRRRASEVGVAYEEVGRGDGGQFIAVNQVRGRVLLDKIGPYLVDIPAPLSAQLSSPRRDKLLSDQAAAPASSRSGYDLRLERMEDAMIDRWFFTVRNLVNRNRLQSQRLRFMTIDELFQDLSRRIASEE